MSSIWLTNSALVYEPRCGGRGGVAGSQPMNTAVYTGAQINFGELTPYLTNGTDTLVCTRVPPHSPLTAAYHSRCAWPRPLLVDFLLQRRQERPVKGTETLWSQGPVTRDFWKSYSIRPRYSIFKHFRACSACDEIGSQYARHAMKLVPRMLSVR
jgi:hypothetical protein